MLIAVYCVLFAAITVVFISITNTNTITIAILSLLLLFLVLVLVLVLVRVVVLVMPVAALLMIYWGQQPSITESIFTNCQRFADCWLELEIHHKQQADDPHRVRLLHGRACFSRCASLSLRTCILYTYIHIFLSLVFFASLVFLEITSLNLRFAGLLQLWAPELFEDKVQPEMPPLVSANWLWAALSDNPKAALADIVNTKSET